MKKYLLITSILALASSAQAKELHDTKAQAAKLCGSNQSKELYNSKQKVSEVAPKDHHVNQDNDLGNQGKVFFGIEGGWSMVPVDKIKLIKGADAYPKGSSIISGSIGYFVTPEIAIGLSLDYMPNYSIDIKSEDLVLPPSHVGAAIQRITDRKHSIKHNAWVGMLDFYYHPMMNSKISPYFTMGMGLANIDTKSVKYTATNITNLVSQPDEADLLKEKYFKTVKQNIFAWQIGLGTLVDISENLKLNVAAKLKVFPAYRIKVETPFSMFESKQTLGIVNLTAGIRYHF